MGITFQDIPDSNWIFLPMALVTLLPTYFAGRRDKMFLIDKRVIAYRVLAGFTGVGGVLFLIGGISLGLASVFATPLLEYFIWQLLYKRFLRIHNRAPRDMGFNFDMSHSNDPDRFYAFAVFFGTLTPLAIGAIGFVFIGPIILWR